MDLKKIFLTYPRTFGSVMISPKNELVHILIPKCATYTFSIGFKELNYLKYISVILSNQEQDENMKYSNYEFIALIRNPLKRYISGLAQYLVRFEINIDLNDEKNLNYIFNNFTFDEHTGTQSELINFFINRECKIKYFKFEEIDKYFEYLDSKGLVLPRVQKNNHTENIKKENIYNTIKVILEQNPKYVEKLNNYFSEDWELYNKI